jgi:hypothetical protein
MSWGRSRASHRDVKEGRTAAWLDIKKDGLYAKAAPPRQAPSSQGASVHNRDRRGRIGRTGRTGRTGRKDRIGRIGRTDRISRQDRIPYIKETKRDGQRHQ